MAASDHQSGSMLRSGSWLAAFVTIFIILALAKPARADQPQQETEAYCLSCHANPNLMLSLPSGEILPLFISPEILRASVHSPSGIECEACHTNIKTYPHPKIPYQTIRELSRSYYESCKKCHVANYELTQDSIHNQAAVQGNLAAPVCTDCHGAHDVKPAGEPRALISQTCGKCHSAINATYTLSVHGDALLDEENPDVPVCTDCHGVHNIQDPRTAQFRIETPDLCSSCHADADLMAKYGLSNDVYNLYETSWHGVDISVYKANWPNIWHESAVCTDCHGIHEIRKTEDPQSMVNSANLLETCRKCHPGAGPNWIHTWTGHNRISLEKTPYLFYVDTFYATLVPAVLWVSLIYVALQTIHAIIERARKTL
jgi:hypothetical protein